LLNHIKSLPEMINCLEHITFHYLIHSLHLGSLHFFLNRNRSSPSVLLSFKCLSSGMYINFSKTFENEVSRDTGKYRLMQFLTPFM